MKKQLIKEAFRLQQLAGIAPINEIGFESTDQVYDSAIKDALENYAEENYEEGNIESVADVISLMQNDSTLANEVFERALGYVQEKLGNANREDFKAWFSDVAAPINEILPSSDTPRRRGLQREEVGQVYIKITGGSRGEIEDVDILNVPGDPDVFMQSEYDEEINRRTDNGTDEEEMENIEEFADFNKVGDGMYQMVFNPEESAAFISTNLPKVKAYMQKNGYNSVESFVEYLVEEADSEEIYDFLDQIGAEGI